MYNFNDLKNYIETVLNEKLFETLGAEERDTNPFKLFADVGEAQKSYRHLNTVYAKRYGVCSVIASNVTPINGLQIYNMTASIDILVNVDRVLGLDANNYGEYAPVIETRRILDEIAAERSAVAFVYEKVEESKSYTVIPVFTVSTAGTYAVDAAELGKVVPLSFSVDVSVIEGGINSSEISITIDGETVYASQMAEDMVASSEGQTRIGESRSTFNVQEAKYSLSFVMPLTTSALSLRFLGMMHTGENLTPLSIIVKYGKSNTAPTYSHTMTVASVRLTGEIPNNAGLNIELVEADELPS